MFAVEFEADIHDGKIGIPEKYRKQLGKHIKLIALTDEKAEKTIQYSDEYIVYRRALARNDHNSENE